MIHAGVWVTAECNQFMIVWSGRMQRQEELAGQEELEEQQDGPWISHSLCIMYVWQRYFHLFHVFFFQRPLSGLLQFLLINGTSVGLKSNIHHSSTKVHFFSINIVAWHILVPSHILPPWQMLAYNQQKECVAVSINICPWHDPMQFGIKAPGMPCSTPGCRRDVKVTR